MDAAFDLFWSFRSPYSYLAVPGAIRLEQDFRVKIRFRPVLPLAVRDPSFFSPDNVKRAKYIRVDYRRRAEMLGMPHQWPSPDPVVQDMKTYKIAAEQPYIFRLTYLGVEAERCGRGSISRQWMRRSLIRPRIAPPWTRATRRSRNPVTGACRRSCSRASRSSAKTASIPCAGG